MFENKLPTNYCKQSIKSSREWFVFGRNVSAYRCFWVIIDRWGGEIGCGWKRSTSVRIHWENALKVEWGNHLFLEPVIQFCAMENSQFFLSELKKKKWVCVYFDDTSGAQRMCNEWSKPSRWRLMSKSMSRKFSFASARHRSSSSPFFPTLTHFSLSARPLKKTHTRNNRKRKKCWKILQIKRSRRDPQQLRLYVYLLIIFSIRKKESCALPLASQNTAKRYDAQPTRKKRNNKKWRRIYDISN